MSLLILYLPFLGATVSGFFGYVIGRAGSFFVSTAALIFSFLFCFYSLLEVFFYYNIEYLNLGPWIHSGLFSIDWIFVFDSLSSIMCLLVLTISILVHIYSWEYMFYDPHSQRFMSYLSLFTFFMLILVCSDNFVIFFLGWEGIGLSSFLLISFWTTRPQAVKAALKALIINRFGDFFFLVSICGIFFLFGSLDFLIVFSLIPFYKNVFLFICGLSINAITFVSFLLFLAAVGKSAQFGLHTWLPDAMEGPTPVSALIHAATLVTAGIFLIIRCSVIFEFSDLTLNFFILWGSITLLFNAIISNFQVDIKKIIAYSTASQLGYMLISCGFSDYVTTLFHLVNHAFFKALLFLCAGVLIHASLNEQDLRKIIVSFEKSPLTITCLDVGILCLVSFPLFGGFYSKDLILETTISLFNFSAFSYYSSLFGALLTSGYASLLAELGSEEEVYSYKILYFTRRDPLFFFSFPLSILAFLSIFSGALFQVYFDTISGVFFSVIYMNSQTLAFLYCREYTPYFLQILPILLMFLLLFFWSLSCFSSGGVWTYFVFSKKLFNAKNLFYSFELAAINNFFIDEFYYVVVDFFLYSAYVTFELVEKGFLEFFGPLSVVEITTLLTTQSKIFIFSDKIYNYFCLTFVSLFLYLIVVLY